MDTCSSPGCFCRKSWLVPTQYLLGVFMLYLSVTVNSLLESEPGPDVLTLTAVFFMLAFLAATQVGREEARRSPRAFRPSDGFSPLWSRT